MAELLIRKTGKTISINPAVSILNTLLQNKISIQHKCGGRMKCGTCRIRVYSGGEYIRKPSEQEQQRLVAVNADSRDRLACQSFAFRDIEIDIINPA